MSKSMSLRRDKLAMLGAAAVLTASMVAIPSLGNIVKADNPTYTIYVAVDQSVLGGPVLIQPVAYSTTDTSKTVKDVLNAVKGSTDLNFTNTTYGSYLAGVKSTGTSASDVNSVTYNLANYPMASSLTAGATDPHMINTNYNDGMLSEKEFTSMSGWMMAIDSKIFGLKY